MATNRGNSDAFFSFGTDFPQVAEQIIATARTLVPKLEGILGVRGDLGAGLFDKLVQHAQTAQNQTIESVRRTSAEIRGAFEAGVPVPPGGLLGPVQKATQEQAAQMVANIRREIAKLPAAMQQAIGPALPGILEQLTAGVGRNVAGAVSGASRQLGVTGGLNPAAFSSATRQALQSTSADLELQARQARAALKDLNDFGKLGSRDLVRQFAAQGNPFIQPVSGGRLAITDPDDPTRRTAVRATGELYQNQANAQKVLTEAEQKLAHELGLEIEAEHDTLNTTRALAAEQRLYARTIAQLRAGEATQVPGKRGQIRVPGGGYVAINETAGSARQIPGGSLTALENEQAFIREEQARRQAQLRQQERARLAQERSQAAEQRTAPRGYAQSAVAGFFGRGFNPGQRQALDLRHGVENLITTQATLARYAAGGAGIYAAINLVHSLRQEYADFIDSQTDVNIALGKGASVSNEYVQGLEGISRLAGSNVGEALDTAARGIRAFGEAGNASLSGRNKQVGEDVSRAAGQLAVIARKDLKDAAGDIIAIGEAFNLTAENLQQVNDAIAAAKQLGGDPNQISQGLANVGVTAREAGFSLNETANIISLIQARTDQSGQAVATRLSRIISIFGSGGNQAFLRQLGVDTTQSPREQLLGPGGVADVYQGASKAQQAAIRSRLGGTANLRELLVLLDEHNRKLLANATAQDTAGKGQQEFNRRISDFTGLLKKISGDIKNIEVNLVNSGLFDAIGLALKALEPGLHLLSDMLGIYNDLPRPMRSVLALLLEIVLASKLLGAARGLGFIPAVGARSASRAGAREFAAEQALSAYGPYGSTSQLVSRPIAGSSAAIAAARVRRSVARDVVNGLAYEFVPGGPGAPVVERPALGRRGLGSLARGGVTGVQVGLASVGERLRPMAGQLRNFGRQVGAFAGSLPGIATILALGAEVAVSVNRHVVDNLNELDRASQALTKQVDQTPAALRQNAADLKTQAERNRKASGGILGTIGDAATGFRAGATARQEESLAAYNEEAAKAIEAAQKKAAQGRLGDVASVFDLSSEAGITDALKTLQQEGRSATTQFDALGLAIRRIGTDADKSGQKLNSIQQVQFAIGLGNRVAKNITELREIEEGKLSPTAAAIDAVGRVGSFGLFDAGQHHQSERNAKALGKLDPNALATDTQKATTDFLTAHGDPGTEEGKQQLAKILSEALAQDLVGLTDDVKKSVIETLVGDIHGTFAAAAAKEKADADFETLLQQAIPTAQAKSTEQGVTAGLHGGSQSSVQAEGYLQNLRKRRREIVDAMKRVGGEGGLTKDQRAEFEQINAEIRSAELSAIDSRVNSLAIEGQLIESLYGNDQHRVLAQHLKTLRAQMALLTDKDKRAQKQAEINAVLDQLLEQSFQDKATGFFFQDSKDPYKLTGDPTSRRQQLESQIASAQARVADDQTGHYRTVRAAQAGRKIDNSAAIAKAEKERQYILQERENVQRQIDNFSDSGDPGGERRLQQLSKRKQELDRSLRSTNQDLERLRSTDGTTVGGVKEQIELIKASKEKTRADIIALANLQDELRNAKLDAASVARQLNTIDITDPVQVAREALKTARKKFRSDQHAGKDKDTLNADQLAIVQAEQNAQKTAFDQRLQHEQTLYGLQQISGQQYIRFLQNQEATLRGQLSTMHKGQQGYQQRLDELYQVQQALKEANQQATGQFNLGKIRVPTPFEVRRLVQSGAEGVTNLGNTIQAINTTNTIHINGADTATVRQLLIQLLGADQIRRVASSGRRT